MNKIFINNFSHPSQVLTAEAISVTGKSETRKFIHGFDPPMDDKAEAEQVCIDIINSILIHEKLVIPSFALISVASVFGLQNVLTLLNNNIIELVDCNGFTCAITPNKNLFSLGSLSDAFEDTLFSKTIGRIEKRFSSMFKDEKELVNKALLATERCLLPIDTNKLIEDIKKEVIYDINNNNLSKKLDILSTDLSNIEEIDIYKLLRLADINMNLIYASNFNTSNILIDGQAKNVLNYKFSPVIKSLDGVIDSTEVFSQITKQKGLPSLHTLFLNGTITLEDILDIRNNIDGKLFRKWFEDVNYSYDETLKALLNKPKLKMNEKLVKVTRTFLPDIVGLLNPVAGVASSVIDSYIIDKIIKGWHPSVFLDEKLKTHIDRKIEVYDRSQRKKRMEKLFPGVTRNDPCPCGSGKKYKKCCGF